MDEKMTEQVRQLSPQRTVQICTRFSPRELFIIEKNKTARNQSRSDYIVSAATNSGPYKIIDNAWVPQRNLVSDDIAGLQNAYVHICNLRKDMDLQYFAHIPVLEQISRQIHMQCQTYLAEFSPMFTMLEPRTNELLEKYRGASHG